MPRPALPTAPWIHVERLATPGEVSALDRDAVRHVAGARRLRDGDEVTLFDGAGSIATARLCDHERSARIVEVCAVPRRDGGVTVAAALPKGDRLATMIDMCVQLGIDAFIPLRCRRSVVTLTPASRARLARIATEAAKQSRRPWLPELRDEVEPLEAVAAGRAAGAVVLVADASGAEAGSLRRDHPDAPILVLVGPEGGFDDDERRAFDAQGVPRVRLAEDVLRIETAAVAAAALLQRVAVARRHPSGHVE